MLNKGSHGQILVLGAGCGLVSWVEKFRQPHWRPYRAMMFIGLGVSGVIPIIHGVSIYGYQGLEDRMSVSLVALHGAMYIFGAILYAVRASPSFYQTVTDLPSFGGRKGARLVHSTYGAARTRFSTCLYYWRRRRICMPWQRRSITIIPSWDLNAGWIRPNIEAQCKNSLCWTMTSGIMKTRHR